MKLEIELADEDIQIDYSTFFDFIESDEGQILLEKIERVGVNFRKLMSILNQKGALPNDSSKRIWHSLCMAYTNRLPDSVLDWPI